MPEIASTPHALIVAAKDLTYNTRVQRQAGSLVAAGWRISVAALELPDIALRARTPSVEYIRLTLPHPLQACERAWAHWRDRKAVHNTLPAAVKTPAQRRVTGLRRLLVPWAELVTRALFARACYRALDGVRYDVVQAHDAAALRAAARLARKCGAAFVYDALEFVDDRAPTTGGVIARALRRFESWREERLVRRADAVFAIGGAMRDWMTTRYNIAPPFLLRNCREFVDAPARGRLRDALGLAPAARIALCANSIVPGEGLEQFISALMRLPSDIHGVVLGPSRQPDYRRALDDFTRQHGMQSRVHFPAPCRPDEVVSYFADADVGVIPRQNTGRNHYLSLPNRLFEMIMARLPIVASAFPDLDAVITEHDIGTTFDERDPAAIAAAICGALESSAQAHWRAQLELAARRLCWEEESREYCACLAELAAPRAHR